MSYMSNYGNDIGKAFGIFRLPDFYNYMHDAMLKYEPPNTGFTVALCFEYKIIIFTITVKFLAR